jgi:hypothetical protein
LVEREKGVWIGEMEPNRPEIVFCEYSDFEAFSRIRHLIKEICHRARDGR